VILCVIPTSRANMTRKPTKKQPWPRAEFHWTGPKLKATDLKKLGFAISRQYAEFLLWRNGGTPINRGFAIGKKQYRIDHFLGIGTDWDLVPHLLRFRNELPRWSVPIAEVDNDLGDLAFLLVFPIHPFDDTFDNEAVWYYTWFHEEYPKRPDDKRSIVKVADSLRDLVHGLFYNELQVIEE
jgi:hypothetical protein